MSKNVKSVNAKDFKKGEPFVFRQKARHGRGLSGPSTRRRRA
jgi:hypothetical protein